MTAWTALARRAEELGYDTLVSPDPQGDLDPLTTLAAAAAVTTKLHTGTFVAVDRFRDARMLAWQAHTLHKLSDGRFELGLGPGRPEAAERAEALGREFGGARDRVAQLAETVAHLKSQPNRPPLLLSAGGPKMLDFAARQADIVTMAWRPETTPEQAKPLLDRLHEAAADRMDDVELAMNLLAVGDDPAPWIEQFTGIAPAELAARGAVTVLPGTPRQGADALLRWRDEAGISYITINSGFIEEFAPIVELLDGR